MNRWKDWYEQGKRDHERALIDVRYGYYGPYFYFFSERLSRGLDLLLSGPQPSAGRAQSLRESVLLAGRGKEMP